ncbi:MAG: DUF1499 domain-containing protein [Rubricella sp.]
MKTFILAVLGLLVAGTLVTIWYIRTVPSDPATWHVHPLEAPTPETPNTFRAAPVLGGVPTTEERIDLVSPIFDVNPAIIALALDQFALTQSRTERIAGTPESGWMTYVQRSEVMRYPDYISVMVFELENGQSTIAIFSRSRFGYDDLGVNEERVRRWIGTLESFAAQ